MEIGHVLVTTLRTVTILFHASHLLTLSSQCFQSKSLSTREIHDLTIDKKPTTADTIHSSFYHKLFHALFTSFVFQVHVGNTN